MAEHSAEGVHGLLYVDHRRRGLVLLRLGGGDAPDGRVVQRDARVRDEGARAHVPFRVRVRVRVRYLWLAITFALQSPIVGFRAVPCRIT